MNEQIERVVLQYIIDASDIESARKIMYGLKEGEADLADEFKRVNAEARAQAEAINAAAAAAGKEAVEVGKLAGLYDKLNQLKEERSKYTDDADIKGINARITATQKEITALENLGKTRRGNNGEESAALGKLQILNDKLSAAQQKRLSATSDKQIAEYNQEIDAINREIRGLDNLGRAQQQNGEQGNMLGQVFRSLGPLIAGAFAIDKLVAYAQKVIAVTAEFQKFEAVLTNSLGSGSAAQAALANITKFAAQTPFSVQELTSSFIKLANQGFRPTYEEMTKLGDLASSTGKSYDQLAEAILDAQTKEFERLKEFGIITKQAGDKVTFTFKEQKTTVDNNAASIRKYILSLGELKGVSGSMAAISGTLDGQMSNLGDTVDQLFLSIGKLSSGVIGGAIGAMSAAVGGLTSLINKLNEKDLLQTNSIAQNQAEAETAQGLLNRYDELTKNGVQPTGEAKKELDRITVQLRDTLGESVVSINKETGALELNRQAVVQAITQKILLANQEAGTLALQQHNAQERKRLLDLEAISQEKQQQVYADILKTRGAYIETIGRQDNIIKNGSKVSFVDDSKQAQELIEIYKKYAAARAKAKQATVEAGEADEKALQIGKKLAELGFDETAVANLFTSALNAQNAALGGASGAATEYVGALARIEKQIAAVELARKNEEEPALARSAVRLAALNLEKQRLEALGTNYGALGEIIHRIALIEAARNNESERELAISARKLEALNEQKKRLEDLGKDLGIVGDIQRQIEEINAKIPKIKVEADLRDAYKKVDELQRKLESFKLIITFKPGTAEDAEKDAKDYAQKLADQLKNRLEILGKGGEGLGNMLSAGANESLRKLNEQLKAGEISVVEYNRRRVALDKTLQHDLLENSLETVNQQIKALEDSGVKDADKARELQKKKNDILRQLYGEDADNYKTAQDKKREIEDAAFSAGVALVNAYFDNTARNLADQLTGLQNQQAYELELAGDTKGAKEKILKEYKQKEDQVRREQNENAFKQAIFQRGLALFQIGVDTAKGVMSVLSTGGGTSYADFGISAGILSALVIATGVAQAALVLSQPIQKFAKGTRFVEGPGSGTSDSIPAMLSRGEGVMPAGVNRQYGPALNAIYYGTIPAEVLNNFALDYPDYPMHFPQVAGSPTVVVQGAEVGQDILEAISRQPQHFHNYDEDGYTSHLQEREHRETSLNRRLFPQ